MHWNQGKPNKVNSFLWYISHIILLIDLRYLHVNSLVNPRSEPLVHFPKAFAAMAVRTSGSEWWTPARWRVGIEIDPSPTRVKTLRVLLELESLESTLESQKKTP